MDNSGAGTQRDPTHRVDVEPFAGWVTVEMGGRRIASSRRALLVRETGYPPVYYLPREDVEMGSLQRRPERTFCPYKGEASYYGWDDGELSVAFSYEEPFAEVRALEGHLAFYPQRVQRWVALPDSTERPL